MRPRGDYRAYLQGREFSNALRFRLPGPRTAALTDRASWLANAVKGKRVVHVGCVDHLPLIEEKLRQGRWLHRRLCVSSVRCLGVDIDADGIRYVRDVLGLDDVICGDIAAGPIPEIVSASWDVMVVGEVLEHLGNPADFLASLSKSYRDCCRRLLVSAPNALRLENGVFALVSREVVNSDHRCWYSPYTLAKVLTEAGFHVTEVSLVTAHPVRLRGIISGIAWFANKTFPGLRNTVVAAAEF